MLQFFHEYSLGIRVRHGRYVVEYLVCVLVQAN
jgi:hypothetical protein